MTLSKYTINSNKKKSYTKKSKKRVLDAFTHQESQKMNTRKKWLKIIRPKFRKRELTYKGSPPDTNICCSCGNKIKQSVRGLSPRLCLEKYSDNAHRLCNKCWFEPNGFASEHASHQCPGCKYNIPFWKMKEKIKTENTNTQDILFIE